MGLDAFRAGEAEHIAGLSAAADTLSITLTEPSGDFLHRLALPLFCPVPTDTPILEGGVGSTPLSSAGPYFVAENEDSEVLILRRNPNYGGDRAGVFDAIVLSFGGDFTTVQGPLAITLRDEWDGIVGFSSGLFGSANGGFVGHDTRPLATMDFVALNAGGAAFSDPDVRTAAALAIDRFRYTQFGQIPTDAFLPPDLPGADPEVEATLPDPERSARILGGRRFDLTMAIAPGLEGRCEEVDRFCRATAEDLRDDLEAVGFRVEVERVTASELFRDQVRFDLVFGYADILYPDTATFVSDAILSGVPVLWLPEDVRREATRVLGLAGEERTTAAVALAGRLVEEHLVVPLGMLPRSSYVSDRVGCLIYPPFGWGFDLASLCPSG